ncbi:MAG: branched-chain amino acid ABC transporter permease [Rhodospirillales bacterium]|nr:branched-chain amino acid ABC transporter permease [Rhodospirillales bacterium]
MNGRSRSLWVLAVVGLLYVAVGVLQSWPLALTILNDGLIVAITALGVNMQWGYAGLFNVGVSGFFALGGLAVVLVSMPLDPQAWSAGTPRLLVALVILALVIFAAMRLYRVLGAGWLRIVSLIVFIGVGVTVFRTVFNPAAKAVEAINAAVTGNIGGLGLPVPFSFIVAAAFAAAAGWAVAKIALGLRSDYLAIATLGIGQIIISVLMNESWLDRGVKNVVGISRWPVPEEVRLQKQPWFIDLAHTLGMHLTTTSTVFVGLCFAALFTAILLVILLLAELSLRSPWGRMMRAIRDNEVAAEAMGKDVKRRHLQVFVLGCAVIGIAGALFVMLHGLFSPVNYNDALRYTFLIWSMVILGGSGNNLGSVLGALIIMLIWDEAGSVGPHLFALLTSPLADGPLKTHLINSAVEMRLPAVGLVLLLVLRFSPKGLLPER